MKKKLLLYGIVLSIMFDKVYAVNKISCGNTSGIPEGVPVFTRTMILLIKYLVPLALILFGSIDFLKVVFSEDKTDLDKATRKFLIRIAAGVSIFYIIYIVLFIFESMDNSFGIAECIKCFTVSDETCTVYYEEDENHTSEKEEDNKKRETIEKKRDENRKTNEENAEKEKEKANKEKDPDSILNGSRPSSGSDKPLIHGEKTIIIGDSRTVGMTGCRYGEICSYKGNIVIAYSGKGHNWMYYDAIPKINNILNSNLGTRYNIVSLLGVNDLDEINTYIHTYNEMATGVWKDHNLVLVSVNPVTFGNKKIIEFNTKLEANAAQYDNITYCDTYNAIIDNFVAPDGLHYDQATYARIYDIITNDCL